MTRRVRGHGRSLVEAREPEPIASAPPAAVRVAGAVGEREAREVERIAGVLEVAAWARRISHTRHGGFRMDAAR